MAIRRSAAALVALFCLIHVVYIRATAGSPDEVAIELDAAGLVSLDVRINGAGPFRLLLDTGTGMSSVSRSVMRALQLVTVATADVLTPTGTRERDVVRLDAFSVGTASRKGLLASVLEDDDLAAFGAGVVGIIGQNFLADQSYSIDYRRKRLTWNAGTAADEPAGATLPLKQEEGRWLVGLPQGDQGRMLWFVPDSGSASFVLYDRGTALPLETRAVSCCAGLKTVNGRGSARVALVPEFKVGSLVVRSLRALIVKRPGSYVPASDGLLPLSMFSSVSFQPNRQVLRVTF